MNSINYRGYNNFKPLLQNYPISSKDKTIPIYESILPELLSELSAFENFSITLLKRGFSESLAVPTIFIICPEKIKVNTKIPNDFTLTHVYGQNQRH